LKDWPLFEEERLMQRSILLLILLAGPAPIMLAAEPHIEKAAEIIKRFEPGGDDLRNYLFQDHGGGVVIGYGHAVGDKEAAAKLALKKPDNSAASEEEKATAWEKVKSAEACRAPVFYKTAALPTLTLTQADLDQHLLDDLASLQVALQGIFSGQGGTTKYDDFPADAKTALLDVAFTLTVKRLQDQSYKAFRDDLRKGNWKAAAGRSRRIGADPNRNALIRDLLWNAMPAP
jgi:GH24 family phage-related lysozyme (muramidase)